MSTPLANASWPACLSALRLDRWTAGELRPAEAETVRAHVAGCARCRAASEWLREAKETAALPPMRALLAPPTPRPPRIRGLAAATAGLALAAGLVLVLRPDPPGERTKGAGAALGMWVRHGESVRRAGPGEIVAPGDAVRFSVTTPRPAWVAVLSVDPAGRASIYFPEGARAAPVSPGIDVPLPLATRLDETVGVEHVLGLFCDRPIELEPLRAALGSAGELHAPEGCEVTRWHFEKR